MYKEITSLKKIFINSRHLQNILIYLESIRQFDLKCLNNFLKKHYTLYYIPKYSQYKFHFSQRNCNIVSFLMLLYNHRCNSLNAFISYIFFLPAQFAFFLALVLLIQITRLRNAWNVLTPPHHAHHCCISAWYGF